MDVVKDLLNRFFLKPISLAFAVILSLLYFALEVWPYYEKSPEVFWILSAVIVAVNLIYAFLTIKKAKLPKCPQGRVGVLFVFHAVSEEAYINIKHDMIEAFSSTPYAHLISPHCICLRKEDMEGYDYNPGNVVKLLTKTRCVFCVDMQVYTDSANNTSMYNVRTSLAVVHPNYSAKSEQLLAREMAKVISPICNKEFNKEKKIATCQMTGIQLSTAVSYILGLLLFFEEEYAKAAEIFERLYRMSLNSTISVNEEIKKTYALLSLILGNEYMGLFCRDYDIRYIDAAEYHLGVLNDLFPGSYGYHLNMAMIVFVKSRNVAESKAHILACERMNCNQDWRYSSAFLTAYKTRSVQQVEQKYRRAIKYSDYNNMDIIHFIERVLELEPDKIMLHYALGLLYKSRGEKKLMVHHFSAFLDKYNFALSARYKLDIQRDIAEAGCITCDSTDCDKCSCNVA